VAIKQQIIVAADTNRILEKVIMYNRLRLKGLKIGLMDANINEVKKFV